MTEHELAQQVAADTRIAGGRLRASSTPRLPRSPVRLAAGRDVAIGGFGKFSVRERTTRERRDPATGETIQIAASRAASSRQPPR
jgi:DNA-binding protein HU-beta